MGQKVVEATIDLAAHMDERVKYRTVEESWSAVEAAQAFKHGANAVGKAMYESIGREIILADELAKWIGQEDSTIGSLVELLNQRGISATALFFLKSALNGESKEEMLNAAFTDRQRAASRARYENDPKQRAKLEVRQLWEMWRDDHSRYPSKAAFARDMIEKFDELKSVKKIEDWVRSWEREVSQSDT